MTADWRPRVLYAAVAAALLGFDRWTKVWAASRLQFGPDVDVVPGLARFVYAENPGIAFSLFNSGEQTTRWILASFAVTAACVVAAMALRTSASAWRSQLMYALMFAGIVGNLIDRVRTGRVIDFIDVYIGTHHWPVFNVADSAITIGAVLLGLELLGIGADHRTEQREPRTDADS